MIIYLLGQCLPARQVPPTAATENKGANVGGLGALSGLVIAPVALALASNSENLWSAERLEKEAKKYAERVTKTTKGGNKVTQAGNVYSSTYTKAQQGYYDQYVKNHRRAAERIAAKSPNNYLLSSLARDDLRRQSTFGYRLRASVGQRIRGGSIPAGTLPVPGARMPRISSRLPKNPLLSTVKDLENLLQPNRLSRLLPVLIPILVILLLLIVTIVLMGGGGIPIDLGGGGNQPPIDKQSQDVIYWAKQINQTLTSLSGCLINGKLYPFYNVQQQQIANATGLRARIMPGTLCGKGYGTYFCTYLVSDSYRLAGYRNYPTGSNVYKQINEWAKISEYTLVTANDVRNLRPGDVVFWLNTQITSLSELNAHCESCIAEHVDLVYSITITDPVNGLGKMQTIDANAPVKIETYTIKGWQIVSIPWIGFHGVWFGLAH